VGWADDQTDSHQVLAGTQGTLTAIDVQEGTGSPQTVDCTANVCTLTLKYGAIALKVFTRNKNLIVRAQPNAFRKHFKVKDAATYESLPPDSNLTDIVVTGGQKPLSIPAPASPTVITIHIDDGH
jgi:hypothetical protein